jgi:ketosteroid isomerase-like protein
MRELTMPSNLENAKKAYELFLRGDIQGLIAEHLADTCRYSIPGVKDKMPWIGAYEGKQQIANFFQLLSQHVEFTGWENREWIDAGDTIVVLGSTVARMKSTGEEARAEFAEVLKYNAQGKLVSFQDYHDTASMLAALGEELATESHAMQGEKIYEVDLDITGATDHGVTLEAILSGKEKVPLQGARFDVAFEGRAKGRLTGKVRGVDYLIMRADGRTDLDVRATIETDDGHRIAVQVGGVGAPRANEPIVDLIEHVRLTTAAATYDWVNARQVFALGTANLATGKIHIEAYMQ